VNNFGMVLESAGRLKKFRMAKGGQDVTEADPETFFAQSQGIQNST
jgi:hypothetical protein